MLSNLLRYIANWNMAIEIVSLPGKNGGSFHGSLWLTKANWKMAIEIVSLPSKNGGSVHG